MDRSIKIAIGRLDNLLQKELLKKWEPALVRSRDTYYTGGSKELRTFIMAYSLDLSVACNLYGVLNCPKTGTWRMYIDYESTAAVNRQILAYAGVYDDSNDKINGEELIIVKDVVRLMVYSENFSLIKDDSVNLRLKVDQAWAGVCYVFGFGIDFVSE